MNGSKIKIDRRRCISSGNCTAVAPDWFWLDDDDQVMVNELSPPDDVPQDVLDASQQCPVEAIEILNSG